MSVRSTFIPIALAGALACGGDNGDLLGPPPGPATLGSIVATPSALTLAAGQRQTLTMQALSTTNQPITATGYVFTSSAPGIASVSTSGEVTGVTAGSAIITVSLTRGSVTKTVDVPVAVSGSLPLTANVTAGANSDVFTPGSVAIARTGSVTWTFGARTHNVSFEGAAGAPTNIGDTVNASATRTFTTAGTFNYICTLHANMSGTVLVQ